MNKAVNIGIIWANPYNKNMGVAALAYSSLALINDSLKSDYKINFTIIGSSKEEKDKLFVTDEIIEFENIIAHNYLQWKAIIKFILLPGRIHSKKLLQLDYIFDIGEGDSFSDIYGNERFNKILNSKIFFNFLNKKQILLPQTIGPFQAKPNEKRAFKIMQKLQLVLARDSKSCQYTSRHLAKEKIIESIDVAFYLPFVKRNFGHHKTHVGINISGLLWNGGYTQNNQFKMIADFKKLMTAIFNYFSNMPDLQIHIISHVVPNDSIEDDYKIGEEFNKRYKNAILVDRFNSPIEAKSYISGMDFFIGSRMHACIAAFSSNVPVFPIAYSRKFNGLFTDTLRYGWIGDCLNDNETNILEKLDKAFTQKELLKKQITESNINIVEPRINELKKIIRKVISI